MKVTEQYHASWRAGINFQDTLSPENPGKGTFQNIWFANSTNVVSESSPATRVKAVDRQEEGSRQSFNSLSM